MKELVEKTCLLEKCGKKFKTSLGNKKYCSYGCSAESKYQKLIKHYPEKNCKNPECNKLFTPFSYVQMYCTRICYTIHYYRSEVILKVCRFCGKEFKPKHALEMYCQPVCKTVATRLARQMGLSPADPLVDASKKVEEQVIDEQPLEVEPEVNQHDPDWVPSPQLLEKLFPGKEELPGKSEIEEAVEPLETVDEPVQHETMPAVQVIPENEVFEINGVKMHKCPTCKEVVIPANMGECEACLDVKLANFMR